MQVSKYHVLVETKSKNVVEFALIVKRSGRVLLWYSVPHNLATQGRATFENRIRKFYADLAVAKTAQKAAMIERHNQSARTKQQRLARLESDLNAVLAAIEKQQAAVYTSIATQSQTDFLGKIERFSLAV
jgi:IS1 family transposase